MRDHVDIISSHITIIIITRHRASTEHLLTFRIHTMLLYHEVEASLLVGWLAGCLEFNVPFSTNMAISETKARM